VTVASERLLSLFQKVATTIVCLVIGHVATVEEIKRALKDDMFIVCDRCGMSSPIKIDESNHVRTAEPEKLFHGSDLGDLDTWKG
jgi:transcription elongation factor Elf1